MEAIHGADHGDRAVILAGHTRYKALQKLGRESATVLVRSGMTDEQKRKYRLLDNKTHELSGWDFPLLETELAGLDFDGFDFGFPHLDVEALDLDAQEEPDRRAGAAAGLGQY